MSTVTVPAVLRRTRALAMPALHDAVERLPPRLRLPAQYHLGWVDVDGRPVESDGGKNIRAALALLSAAAVGADEVIGVPGAVAIELVHNFSLIHDDLMDDDRERRHRLTVWAAYTPAVAIIVGDALATLATQVLLDAPPPANARALAALQSATAHMIAGQADDLAFEGRHDVALDDCIEMARGKTGALLGCAASLGAILADASEARVEALAAFGMHLGIAFQAVDDILGIWGDPAVTGKPVCSDIHQRKNTIPIVAALEQSGSDELRALLGAETITDSDAARAAMLIDDHGGRAVTEKIAASSLNAALDALERVDPPAAAAAELTAVANFVVGRDK